MTVELSLSVGGSVGMGRVEGHHFQVTSQCHRIFNRVHVSLMLRCS